MLMYIVSQKNIPNVFS